MTDGQPSRELGRFVGAVRVDQRVEARSDKVRVGRRAPAPAGRTERLVEAALRDQALSERLDLRTTPSTSPSWTRRSTSLPRA
jgi:hypothetical protein